MFVGVVYYNDYVVNIGYQIYCVIYVFDQFVRDYLVCQVVFFVYFYCVEDCCSDFVVMDYCKRGCVVKIRGVCQFGDGLFICVDYICVFFVFVWERVYVQYVIFRLQSDVFVVYIVGYQCWNIDVEVYIYVVFKFLSGMFCYLVMILFYGLGFFMFVGCDLFDVFFVIVLDDVMYIDVWQVDVIWVE